MDALHAAGDARTASGSAPEAVPTMPGRGTDAVTPGRGKRPLPARHTLLLSGVLASASLALVTLLRGGGHVIGNVHLAWWVLAPAFAAAEVLVVHVEINQDAHTFTLSELPFVLALFFATPTNLILGRLLGAVVVLAVVERQGLVKLVFNLTLFFAECCVALTLVSHLVGGRTVHDPLTWVVALLAIVVADTLGIGSVSLVIKWHGGEPKTGRLLLTGAITGLVNTCLAVIASILLIRDPAAVAPMGVVVMITVIAYRGYTSLSQRYSSLQMLYEFTRVMSGAMRPETTLEHILGEARQMLRADRSTIALLGGDASTGGLQLTLHSGAALVQEESVFVLPDLLRRRVVEQQETVVISRTARAEDQVAVLTSLGVKDCMVAPVVSGGAVTGVILVADRMGDVSTFDGEDARLFATLSAQAGVALENGRLIEKLREQAREREHEALHDALTGLPNRTNFYRRSEAALQDVSAHGGRTATLLMDLDRFKEVNDTLGHDSGDRLLETIANRLRMVVTEPGMVARLGGDEFAVLLPDIDTTEQALAVAEQLQHQLTQPIVIDALTLEVGVSIGIAMCPDHGRDLTTIMQRADVAMYTAKRSRGRSAVYDPQEDWNSAERLALAGELRAALERGEIDVHFQPIARVSDGQVIAVEALVRWPHPVLGQLSPDQFIPIAERTGLIDLLTTYVVERSLRQHRIWRESDIDLRVAVNLPVQALLDIEWPNRLERLLGGADVDAGRLILEITETGIMSDPSRMIGVLNRLATLGVKVAIDDFGTGYSSLSYLQRLPVTEIKIDKSFIFAMASDRGASTIVRSVIDLARSLSLGVIAEGVEDQRTWDTLCAMGCDYVQGYYLTRPIPAHDLTEWLLQRRAMLGSSV